MERTEGFAFVVKQLKIVNVVGARPNFMKVAPLYREYSKHHDRIAPTLVHTGQHYDDTMSRIFLSEFGLPEPDENLGVGSSSHAVQVARIMVRLERILVSDPPDVVLVVGDVNSTMAAAIVAAKLHLPVAHIEAGLRSFDRSMPEEINRIVTDALADSLFTTCRDASENLYHEGVTADKVFFVGNTIIDTLLEMKPLFESRLGAERLVIGDQSYGFITLHRPANVDDKSRLDLVCDAFEAIQERSRLIWPLHPRTRKMLEVYQLMARVQSMRNLVLLDPLGYIDSLALMSRAQFVMTDSGAIQEETTFLGIPCLTLRENTERPITITEGTNELVGTNPELILMKAQNIIQGNGKKGSIPALWDGKASVRVVEALLRVYG